MDLFQVLEKDHRSILSALDRLSETTDRALRTRVELLTKLKETLELHASFEEKILYPTLASYKEAKPSAKKSRQEHKRIQKQLHRLTKIPRNEPEWETEFKMLKAQIESHVKAEERSIFKLAQTLLSPEQLEDLTTRIEEDRKERGESGLRRKPPQT